MRKKIKDGDLSPGDKLPTTKEFVRDFGIGASTIRLAMAELGEEGLVESLRRRGTFVTKGGKGQTEDQSNHPTSKSPKRLRCIGVLGLVHFITSHDSYGYLRETSEGINIECNRQNACAISLPCSLFDMDNEGVYQKLIKLNCDGLLKTVTLGILIFLAT